MRSRPLAWSAPVCRQVRFKPECAPSHPPSGNTSHLNLLPSPTAQAGRRDSPVRSLWIRSGSGPQGLGRKPCRERSGQGPYQVPGRDLTGLGQGRVRLRPGAAVTEPAVSVTARMGQGACQGMGRILTRACAARRLRAGEAPVLVWYGHVFQPGPGPGRPIVESGSGGVLRSCGTQ